MMRWWRTRSQAARFDLAVRATFYANFVTVPLLAAGAVRLDDNGLAAGITALLTTVHSIACVLLSRAGIEHCLGRRARPYGLIAACAGSAVLISAVAIAAYPEPTPGHPDGPATAMLLIIGVSSAAALSTALPLPAALAAGLLAAAALGGLSAAQGAADPIGPAVGLAGLTVFVVLTCRVSLWMLRVVWELDRARQVQASLAVADERLRFARDLHDVVGRTLSVVALKSELAAQLARRGRDDAVTEMLDVRRIAQESLTELRAVVGGYRTADLGVELAGARSLLASAGIECRIIGDGAGLPAEIQGTLGWAVREATTNVLRHSDARSCVIDLRAAPDGTVTLTMDNDGVDRAPTNSAGRVRFGSGLIGLAERVAGLNGVVTAELRSDRRFRLTAQLPPTVIAPVAEPSRP